MKVALVTGCSSGFGKATVIRLLQDPTWHVVATTRHAIDIAAASNLDILQANVADGEGRARIVEHVQQNFGALDCLINNAGYALAGPLETLTETDIRAQFEVNFFAPLLLTRDLLPALRQARGKVINVSSVFGFVGMPLQSLYVASKFALEGLSESLNRELHQHGVCVTIVEPGGFRTNFASNIHWSQEPNADATYANQITGLRQLLARLTSRENGNDPTQVAELIVRIANSNKPPLRARIGSDSHALHYLRRLLPQRASDAVISRLAARILQVR